MESSYQVLRIALFLSGTIQVLTSIKASDVMSENKFRCCQILIVVSLTCDGMPGWSLIIKKKSKKKLLLRILIPRRQERKKNSNY